MRSFNRRSFLQSTSATAALIGFQQFTQRIAWGDAARTAEALTPVVDRTTGLPLLQLPAGFEYQSFGWTSEPLADGKKTPPLHDGMAVIAHSENELVLCRNHEVLEGKSFGNEAMTYDPSAGGGCTRLIFDRKEGSFARAESVLAGTAKNCAGGPTPWGSWLTCEETVYGPGDKTPKGDVVSFEREHGYIFEVPNAGKGNVEPLRAMGRFVHEAVAVDPKSGIVYETEDRGTAGFYRFLPEEPSKLQAGGRLQMMCLAGRDDTRQGLETGATFDTTWVDIEDPERAHSPAGGDTLGVYMQGKEQGGTTFGRLEGCWYRDGKIYLVSTSGGDAGAGQIFEYEPAQETIHLLFESPSRDVLDSPDNITVHPDGTIVLCEDGTQMPQRLHRLSPEGKLATLAANNIVLQGEWLGLKGDYRGKEWAGACFSPDGDWLFANLQTPGVTFAIRWPSLRELPACVSKLRDLCGLRG